MGDAEVALSLGIGLLHLLTLYFYWPFLFSMLLCYAAYSIYRKKSCLPVSGKAVLITGCDSGFGHDCATKLDDAGFEVYAGVYNTESKGAEILRKRTSGRVHVISVDVTNEESVADAIECIIEKKKGLWAVINNAGINFPGDVELLTIDQYKKVAEVNLYGMIRVTKACLPLLRLSKGRVINITSVKGRYSMPGDSAYMASKHAGECVSDALRMEMRRFGIKVVIIEPGDFSKATSIMDANNLNRIKGELDTMWENASTEVKDTYGQDYIEKYKNMGDFENNRASTTRPVANAILDALLNEDPKVRYSIGGSGLLIDKHHLLCKWYYHIPAFISDPILCYMFGYPVEPPNSFNHDRVDHKSKSE